MGIEVLEDKKELFNRLKKRSEVDPITECWLWKGALNSVTYGHGVITLWKHSPKFYIHRLSAYIHFNYDLGNKELQVNHWCQNSNCWNPKHIYIGTQTDNMQDKAIHGTNHSWNTGITHCKHGHEFTDENTYEYKEGNKIERCCRKCRANRAQEYRNPTNKEDE